MYSKLRLHSTRFFLCGAILVCGKKGKKGNAKNPYQSLLLSTKRPVCKFLYVLPYHSFAWSQPLSISLFFSSSLTLSIPMRIFPNTCIPKLSGTVCAQHQAGFYQCIFSSSFLPNLRKSPRTRNICRLKSVAMYRIQSRMSNEYLFTLRSIFTQNFAHSVDQSSRI